jgi:hypothetical protein
MQRHLLNGKKKENNNNSPSQHNEWKFAKYQPYREKGGVGSAS